MSDNSGYVYALFNPEAKGLIKIGKTNRDPEKRASELSSATGVPTPFIVIYSAFFDDCINAEVYVHTLLVDKRLSDNKEFFRVTPTEAIKAIIQAENRFKTTTNKSDENVNSDSGLNNLQEKKLSQENICREIIDTAIFTLYGTNPNILQDEKEAIKLYKEAANLGCTEAYDGLGDLYYEKYVYDGSKNDLELALYYYKEGVLHNYAKSWGGMAICYWDLKNFSNSDKCWVKLFTDPSMKGKEKEIANLIYSFIKYMAGTRKWKHDKSLEAFFQELKNKQTGKKWF